MSYDTSPAGMAAGASKQNADLANQKAGSALGASGTYSDAPNAASPSEGTIASNEINNHAAAAKPAGSTSDTGRVQP